MLETIDVTQPMIEAARGAEMAAYQADRLLGPAPATPTPDRVIRAMLEAALAAGMADPQRSCETAGTPVVTRSGA